MDLNGIITTVAGNGSNSRYGYSGDGGPAINASLNEPFGVAVDASGNLFIADSGNNVIRKVDPNGIITTVAGNYSTGESHGGDGGAATNASLYNPCGVAVDAAGNLFIADTFNGRIRKVDTNGIITTVAGNGTNGYSGDGGAATNASLYNPDGVAVDATGNLFIADSANGRIRKVDTNGIITTVAGDGYVERRRSATNASLVPVWLWTPPATCSLRTGATLASAKWTPTALLRLWQAMALKVIPATAAWPPMPACVIPTVWLWTPPATCSLRTRTTTASGR